MVSSAMASKREPTMTVTGPVDSSAGTGSLLRKGFSLPAK